MIDMRERPIKVRPSLSPDYPTSAWPCLRCGVLNVVRRRQKNYVCRDCKWADPRGVRRLLTNNGGELMARNAFALDKLVEQVIELKPDADITYGDPDGIGVVRSVTFDRDTSKWLWPLLEVELDGRIANAEIRRNILTLTFQGTSPLADNVDPFPLAEVDAILHKP